MLLITAISITAGILCFFILRFIQLMVAASSYRVETLSLFPMMTVMSVVFASLVQMIQLKG